MMVTTFLTITAVLIPVAAPRRPFSHKYHLTQVVACEICHAAAETSTKAEDNLIPDKSACVNCHDEVLIAPPRASGVQRFNHSKHLKTGCTGCHKGIQESEDVPRDKAVKAHFPLMKDCQVCHTKVNPPESCKECHAGTRPELRQAKP